MQSQATTVKRYLAELPKDRRDAINAIRSTILEHLPKGYEEGMQYGMIGYFVPHSIFPEGYHCAPEEPLPFAALASQKNHMAVYLMCVQGDAEHSAWFQKAWKATGKKLDMGKSCVRFKRLDDVPLEVLGQAIARIPVKEYVEAYRALRAGEASPSPRSSARKKA